MSCEQEEPKRKRGRPRLPPGRALKLRQVRLSDSHWEKAQALGENDEASDGIRRAIDLAWDAKKKGKTRRSRD